MADKLNPAVDDGRSILAHDDEKRSSNRTAAPVPAVADDVVDEVGMGSFPASDPPGGWSGG